MKKRAERQVTAQIVPVSFLNFVCYLNVGLPLAVLPGFVHDRLGYGAVLAGLAISAQYFATLCSRSVTGRMSDTRGPKYTVLVGFIASGVAALLLLLSGLVPQWPIASLLVMLCSRFAMGLAESCVGTCNITWNIGRVGAAHTAAIIAWSGICSYGAIAVGAPLGVSIAGTAGLPGVGLAMLAAALLGCLLTVTKQGVAVVGGEQMGFARAALQVLPYGAALAAGSAGFGTLAAFIALFFDSRGWNGASTSLALFGISFVLTRLLFASQIGRRGGMRVAMVSFATEALGLLLLGITPTRSLAYLGAVLTGAGFSLLYPALGVEAVGRVPPGSRGSAISAFSVFFDVALGITGPIAGYAASHSLSGFQAPFRLAAAEGLFGLGLAIWLARRHGRPPARVVEPS